MPTLMIHLIHMYTTCNIQHFDVSSCIYQPYFDLGSLSPEKRHISIFNVNLNFKILILFSIK